MSHLGRVLRKDLEYQEAWRSNLAMPIYDRTRVACNCRASYSVTDHAKDCSSLQSPSPELCNEIANQILKNFFDVHYQRVNDKGVFTCAHGTPYRYACEECDAEDRKAMGL